MKYHALFVICEKAAKFEIVLCCKLWVALKGLKYLSTFQAMSKLWENGRIEVEDNMDLARDINAAMYNILCSLPSQQDPLIPFYGLSPGTSSAFVVC